MAPTKNEWSEFEQHLTALGWSRAELARRLDLHPNSISKWSKPPGYAMAYLRLAAEVAEMARKLERKR